MLKLLLKLTLLALATLHANQIFAATISIALAGPFSGPYKAYGIQLLTGASQAAADINQQGGINGNSLEIIPINDFNKPQKAISAAKIITKNKKISAIIGHASSETTLAALSIYAKNKLLTIIPSASSDKITRQSFTTVFRMTATDEQQVNSTSEFLVKKIKSKRIAVLYTDDSHNKQLADKINEKINNFGKPPVLYQGVNKGNRNYSKIINRFTELAVDTIYFAGTYPEVGSLVKNMQIAKLQIPLVTSDGIANNDFIKYARTIDHTNPVIMMFPKDYTKQEQNENLISTMQANKLETKGYTLNAYAAVQIIAKAIEQTENSTDGVILANWLHQNKIATVMGNIFWDTNGDIANDHYQAYIWNEKGKYNNLK